MDPTLAEKIERLVEAARRVDRYFDGQTMPVAATVEVLNGLSDAVEPITPADLAALRTMSLDSAGRGSAERKQAGTASSGAEVQSPLPAGSGAPPAAPAAAEDAKCYWCGELTESLAGNPAKWPLRFPANDNTGIVRWHHTGCVMDRLYGNSAS